MDDGVEVYTKGKFSKKYFLCFGYLQMNDGAEF